MVDCWKDSNVHSWSDRMSAVMKTEFPDMIGRAAKSGSIGQEELAEIKQKTPVGVHGVIDKIMARDDLHDGDLCGVTPTGMLHEAWTQVIKDDNIPALVDMLRDIGGTCLQGDTHRLFSLILGSARSDGQLEGGDQQQQPLLHSPTTTVVVAGGGDESAGDIPFTLPMAEERRMRRKKRGPFSRIK